jgi:beta-lactamase regulating signal transducer with metallopeptidase domain
MFTLSNIVAASLFVIAIGLIGFVPFFRRRPAAMHILWLIVLAKFAAPAFIPLPILPANAPQSVLPDAAIPAPASAVLIEAPHENAPVLAARHARAPVTISAPIPWAMILLAISLSGTVLLLIQTLFKLASLLRLVRHSSTDPRLSCLLAQCINRMSPGRAVDARVIHAHCAPFLLALPRTPRIYIPQAMLDELSDDQLAPILCHELAHYVRHDAVANLFAFFVRALFWWNPLAWFARRQLRHAQELCCDAMVISDQHISRREYAEILFSTLEKLAGVDQTPAHLAVGWGDVASLKERFRMIGDRRVTPRLSRFWIVIALVLGVALLCVPGRAQSQPAKAPAAKSKESPKTRLRLIQLIDGETGEALADIRLQTDAQVYTTDARGIADVTLPEAGNASLSLASRGWWSDNMNALGSSIRIRQPGDKNAPAPDPAQPIKIKIWRGTVVTGRLLDPDSKPIPNATLTVSTYIMNQEWKKRLGMDLGWNSWDHGDMPNWSYRFATDADGRFEVTVPPDDARSWIRISTMQFGDNYATHLDPNGPAKAIVKYAPFEHQIEGPSVNGEISAGDLQLTRGTVLRGKVVDADGKPLSGITLYTSSKHGPYYGRSVLSGPDGKYEFLPMHPGSFTLSPYAQYRDEKGVTNSRDVQAVFLPQPINLPESDKPVEMIIRAVPHVTLEFDWVDRRARKGPVAYYGCFELHGQVKRDDGTLVWWRGETELVERDGKKILTIKVPAALKTPTLTLPADSVVTASYDDGEQKSGPGMLELRDITQPRHRVIYGDEPKPRKN